MNRCFNSFKGIYDVSLHGMAQKGSSWWNNQDEAKCEFGGGGFVVCFVLCLKWYILVSKVELCWWKVLILSSPASHNHSHSEPLSTGTERPEPLERALHAMVHTGAFITHYSKKTNQKKQDGC